MAVDNWIRVKPLINQFAIEELETKYDIVLPESLKLCIKENNAGRPRPNGFKTNSGNELEFRALISYNKEDNNSIYNVIDYFMDEYAGKMIPFAFDSAGNYFCIRDNRVFFWTQENEFYELASDFEKFVEQICDI